MEAFDKMRFLFATFFLLANGLQVKGDNYLSADGITTKQWFLILIISQFGENAPMLTEVANSMGTSRQNVKQLALKLEEKGFLVIEKDTSDSRALRLKLTTKNKDFWDNREESDTKFILNIFKNLTTEEIDQMYNGMNKLLKDFRN